MPECLHGWLDDDNPVRDAFVDTLKLADLGFQDVDPAITGRPGYHPAALLRLYIYGYLNRIQSSAGWNEKRGATSMLTLGQVAPFWRDHKRRYRIAIEQPAI